MSPPDDWAPTPKDQQDLNGARHQGDLEDVRRLLLGPEQDRLAAVEKRLRDRPLEPRALGQVLPEAIAARQAQDNRLSKALAPTFVEALQISVRKEPEKVAEAIFPILGPAIRRAVSQALRDLAQTVNQTLEHSLSAQGLKWRLESLRTGKSFAEIVLLHSLVYRVEQVFLIHRESGLLLLHRVADSVETVDPEMVSGMLTAIGDFVQDSFGGKESPLRTMQVGQRTVWVEQGTHAVLAGIIQGSAPPELRTLLQETLETIHLEQGDQLRNFGGDATVFAGSGPHLEDCLQYQTRQRQGSTNYRFFYILLAVLLAMAAGLAWVGYTKFRDNRNWDHYLEKLQAEPGIVITHTDRRDGQRLVAGLRDPLATAPDQLLEGTDLKPQNVLGQWEPYHSFLPDFVVARARLLLRPPPEVSFSLEKNRLLATGTAPNAWIAAAKDLARALPGVDHFDATGLISEEQGEMDRLQQQIETTKFAFAVGATALDPAHKALIPKLADQIQAIYQAAGNLDQPIYIQVVGLTDSTGHKSINQRLALDRALQVRAALLANGVGPQQVTAVRGNLAESRGVILRVSFPGRSD